MIVDPDRPPGGTAASAGPPPDSPDSPGPPETVRAPAELDELDRRILAALQADASLTNLALAERVHASPPTCLRRVRRLVESGVIARQVAILDPAAFGAALAAIVEVGLDHQGADRLADFERRAVAEAEVLQCYRVSPGPDFVLVVQVRDMPAYHALAQRLFAADANVRSVRTYFVTHRAKFETAIPV